MPAKSKRTQSSRGRQQSTQQRKEPQKRQARRAQERSRAAPETNGHEEAALSGGFEQPFRAASQFARAASEQIKQAAGEGGWARARPQVLGWSGTGPAEQFEDLVRQFWTAGGSNGPTRYMEAMARANVEMVGLLGRRSRAYLELPTQLSRCRTPQQMLEEQAKFFQDMLHDYQVTNDRVVNCWIEATGAPAEQR